MKVFRLFCLKNILYLILKNKITVLGFNFVGDGLRDAAEPFST